MKKCLLSPSLTGLALIFSAILGILTASSPFKDIYGLLLESIPFTSLPFSGLDWVNEALLGFFFAILGVELRRDCESGPLSNPKSALFPLLGALGGMALPALIAFLAALLSPKSAGLNGWAIPTATDAALTVPLLAMAKTLPQSIRSFVSALAIFDDLGAILILALFYGHTPDLFWLTILPLPLALLIWIGKSGLKPQYLLTLSIAVTGILWYFLCRAGIAPELAGLALGLTLPKESGMRLASFLSLPVAWIILPLFAFCNTGIDLTKCHFDYFQSGAFLGPSLGLFLGKPLGIALIVLLCEKAGLPAPWKKHERHWLLGAFMSCGIGFTISLLLSRLAYPAIDFQMQAEAGVALASTLSALCAYFLLKRSSYLNR
ncbi:Na+/H+ antiporter NhaA [Acetobacteraceae bacterium]|nr:Na+/H+ antiporter NhaA [Acetobacteraceae bacterium]